MVRKLLAPDDSTTTAIIRIVLGVAIATPSPSRTGQPGLAHS